jgi:hypothetical protein
VIVVPERRSRKTLVFGISQSGKSTFALWLALEYGKQVVIWDANEVFLSVVKEPVSNLDDLQDALNAEEPVIVYDASGFADKPGEFEAFAMLLEQYDGLTLLIDESGDIQRASGPNHGLDRLLRRAGRRGNDIIETTHRPTDIATLNRNLTTDVYLFFMWNKKGLKNISDEFGDNVAEAEADLPPDGYAFIQLDPHTGRFEVVDEPQEWYIDLNEQLPEKISVALPDNHSRVWRETVTHG